MKYLKVWTDFEEVLEMLDDEEVGRLFRAMLNYADTGETPTNLTGNERYVWPIARRDIDHAAEESMTNTENGKKGGRPKTEQNRKKPEETEENRAEPEESQKEKKEKEIKRKEMKSSFMADDDAHRIQQQQDQVLDAAADAGFKMSNNVRASLIRLYADHGQKVIDALGECSRHGAPNIAYLEAVLKGDGKKRKEQKDQYEQRDYGGEDDEAVARMMDRMRRDAW